MGEVITGRPIVITQATVRKLEQAFKDGLSVSEACFVSGISRTAYYERKRMDEGFTHKMELAKAYVQIKARKTVVYAIDAGNLNAAEWWLERKARNEFGAHPVDQETEWDKQTETSQQDDVLLQILESMHAVADKAIKQTASPQHTALKAISTELVALKPEEPTKTVVQAVAQSKPIQSVTTVATSTDEVLADLYYED